MARGQGKQAKSLKRRVGTRRPRKTLLVFCEGEQTEPDYLTALRLEPSVRDVAAVDIRIEKKHGGAVPLSLVQAAVSALARALDEEAEIDEFWCVFDVEWPRNHPALREALQLARQYEIQVAVSNPCFELWLVLHFREHTAWLDNNGARRLRRECDGQPDKGLDGSAYMSRRNDAARRAKLLDERHAGNGTQFPRDNPSSGMHRLLATVESPPSRRVT